MLKLTSPFIKENYFKIAYSLSVIIIILLLLIYFRCGLYILIKSLFYFIPLLILIATILIYKLRFFNLPLSHREYLSFLSNFFTINSLHITLFNFMLVILSFIVLPLTLRRNLVYLGLVSTSGTLLLSQILLAKSINKYCYFLQIGLIHLSLTWGVTLKYPFFFGYGDILSHLSKIESLSLNGTSGLGIVYQNFPFYHEFLAAGHIILGGGLITDYFLILGILSLLYFFLSYLIFNEIFNERRMAFIFTWFFLFNRVIIFESRYLITRNMALIFILCIIFLLLKRNKENLLHITTLVFVFSIALVLTHHITTLFFIILLWAIILIRAIEMRQIKFQFFEKYTVVLTIGTVLYLLLFGGQFTQIFSRKANQSIQALFSRMGGDTVIGSAMPASSINAIKSLVGSIDLMVVLFFSALGCLYILSKFGTENSDRKVFFILGILSLAFVIPNPILEYFKMDLLLYRAKAITSIFWILPFSIGFISYFKNILSGKKFCLRQFGIFIAIFLICFTAVANIETASDVTEIIESSHAERRYFTSSELNSFHFIRSNTLPEPKDFVSDHFSERYWHHFGGYNSSGKSYYLIREVYENELPSKDYDELSKIFESDVFIYFE